MRKEGMGKEMRRRETPTNDLSAVLQLSTQLANFCKGWVIFGSNIDHWNTTVEKSSCEVSSSPLSSYSLFPTFSITPSFSERSEKYFASLTNSASTFLSLREVAACFTEEDTMSSSFVPFIITVSLKRTAKSCTYQTRSI